MNRTELDRILKIVEEQTVRARKLGGYSTEAESLLVMWEVLLEVLRHLRDKAK